VYFLSLFFGNACYPTIIIKDGVPLPTRERSYWRLSLCTLCWRMRLDMASVLSARAVPSASVMNRP
jgi:hypothetical protein